MIHEIRTYDLQPRSVPEFLERTSGKIAKRLEYSKLIGFFFTEIGRLNQVVHIWEYEDLNHRSEIREQVVKDGIWPPDNASLVISMQSDIFLPAPFLPELAVNRTIGPLFEFRVYKYPAGAIPKVVDAWSTNIEARLRLSPTVGIWSSELGTLNAWAHMWAYESYEHRTQVGKDFPSVGWPPDSGPAPVSMSTSLMHAARFSPIQ